MSLYVGDRRICIPDGHLRRVTYTRCRIDTINSPDDEQCSKHVEIWNKHIPKKTVPEVGHLQELYRDVGQHNTKYYLVSH